MQVYAEVTTSASCTVWMCRVQDWLHRLVDGTLPGELVAPHRKMDRACATCGDTFERTSHPCIHKPTPFASLMLLPLRAYVGGWVMLGCWVVINRPMSLHRCGCPFVACSFACVCRSGGQLMNSCRGKPGTARTTATIPDISFIRSHRRNFASSKHGSSTGMSHTSL